MADQDDPNLQPVTNLDRALAPAERTQVRAARHGGTDRTATAHPPQHFIAVIDRAHFRIYRVSELPTGGPPQLGLAEAFDILAGHQQYTDRDADMAGRFPGGSGRPGGSGAGTIDERLPMQNEHQRRIVNDIVKSLARFFNAHPDATWDFAAGPGVHQAVVSHLPEPVRSRLQLSIVKELTHQTPAQLQAHLNL